MLSYFVKKGQLCRTSHGQYCFPESRSYDFIGLLNENLAVMPQAVVGLRTALRMYDLTEDVYELELIVPTTNVPKRKLHDVTLYQMSPRIYKIDVAMINGIPVTSRERTIIDLLRTGDSLSVVLDVMYRSRNQGHLISLSQLKRLSVPFRVKGRVSQLLEAYL